MSVRLVVDVTIKQGTADDLATAYAALMTRAAEQPGLLSHQLCQSLDDPDRWIVTSEWESIEQSSAWDRSEVHGTLLAPLRACFASASRAGFDVRDGVRVT